MNMTKKTLPILSNGLETNKEITIEEMNSREENAKVVWEAVKELLTGEKEMSHMSGDIELCGKTADDVLREIKDKEHTK